MIPYFSLSWRLCDDVLTLFSKWSLKENFLFLTSWFGDWSYEIAITFCLRYGNIYLWYFPSIIFKIDLYYYLEVSRFVRSIPFSIISFPLSNMILLLRIWRFFAKACLIFEHGISEIDKSKSLSYHLNWALLKVCRC